MTATLWDAFDLLHAGSLALSRMEHNGLRVDVNYLDQCIEDTKSKIKEIENDLKKDEVFSVWKKEFGDKTKINSLPQLAHVVFDKLGYEKSGQFTKKGNDKRDESAFEHVKIPFVQNYFRAAKLKKSLSTYLMGIRREVVDGFIHPGFNLHTVETFRSSGSEPNIQNLPVRNPEIAEIIRRCYIPRDGHVFVEVDYGALEFRVAAAFWCDNNMIYYASDKSKDIHRDVAALAYRIDDPKKVTKNVRYCGKNGFVFPYLYGSDYIRISQNMWEMIDDLKLTVDDVPMKKHLRSKGIRGLGKCDRGEYPVEGTFEYQIKSVQDWWCNSFPTYVKRKKEWISNYRKTCEFTMMTGFRCSGLYTSNFLLNAPIQGPGFHLLLWSLPRIQRILDKRKMKSLLVAEIHDCVLGDIPVEEVQDFITICKQVMTEKIRKAWSWITVPLEIEVDVTPIGKSWFDKKPWIEVEGVWQPKDKVA